MTGATPNPTTMRMGPLSTGRLSRVRTAWVLTLAILSASCATSQRFPSAPIVLICPWAAGGGTDRIARQIAVLLERDLEVPVNVVNATGGDGVTGHSRGALARPDGYTVTLVTIELASLHWRGMTNISPADFAPLGLVNRDGAAIFVRTDSPYQDLKSLEQAIRANPGALRASGTSTAGIWHLALAGWLTTSGLGANDVIWVSIGGSAPSLQELVAGGLDLVMCSLPEAQALLSAGRVRSLGVMAESRLATFPDVPTFREQGSTWSIETVRGLAVPKDTAPERTRVLADAVARVAQSDAYRDALTRAGFSPAHEGPEAFAATLQGMDRRLGALLTSPAFANLTVKPVDAMFFPLVIASAMALAFVGLAVSTRRSAGAPDTVPATHDSDAPPGVAGGWIAFAEVVLWIVVYLAVAEYVGFILTAATLLIIHLWRLGTRLRVAILVTLLIVPLVYQIFAVALRVPLPRGVFGW